MALDWKKTSQWWYGRFTENGRTKLVNLDIKIAGKRPKRIQANGPGVDPAFLHSRSRALQKHDTLRDEIRKKQNLEELQQRIIELKTGGRFKPVKLADLADSWARIPRKREPDERYAGQCKAGLRRFAAFIVQRFPSVDDLAAVTREHVAAFMEKEAARGVSPKTWNDTLKLLRGTFKHLQPEADAYRRYLIATPTRESETVNRAPFAPAELKAVLDATQGDEFARPVIVTGVCTAMRRGDVCLLKWADVDLERGFITVKTAKTGQTVTIPIFPLLNDELQKQKGNGSEYVFPDQAAMYQANPDGITWRIRKVLAEAGFKDKADAEEGEKIRGEIHADRKGGLRRASIRGFHSFRVTWVTLALTAGVPLELVQKVTGHKTAEIVLKHYFQPGREAFRKALQSAMPKLLMTGAKPRDEQLKDILRRMNPKKLRDRALALLAEHGG